MNSKPVPNFSSRSAAQTAAAVCVTAPAVAGQGGGTLSRCFRCSVDGEPDPCQSSYCNEYRIECGLDPVVGQGGNTNASSWLSIADFLVRQNLRDVLAARHAAAQGAQAERAPGGAA